MDVKSYAEIIIRNIKRFFQNINGRSQYKRSNVIIISSWIDNLASFIKNPIKKNPANLQLFQNYPNPFNPVTKISFKIEKQQKVVLDIFDVTGKLICKLVDNTFYAGSHELFWDGKDKKGNLVNTGI